MATKDSNSSRKSLEDKPNRLTTLLSFGRTKPNEGAIGNWNTSAKRRRSLSKSRRERPMSTMDKSRELPYLYQLLADNKLNEHEVWEGDPGLFPVIYQFKDQFEKMEPVTSVVTFYLPPLPEFGGHSSKCYKINNDLSSYEAVGLICKKLGVNNPQNYCLSTLRQFLMADNEPLFIYGLGTLFEKWELRVLLKSSVVPDYKALLAVETPPNAENILILNLPPLQEFGGLNKKVMKADSTVPIRGIVESLCSKYRISNAERFSVVTTKDSKWQFVLNPEATLGDYGFSTHIQKWELDLVFNALLPDFVTHHTYKPMYGWCQVEQIPLDTLCARVIIASLEPLAATASKLQKEMGFMKSLLSATQKDLRTTKSQLTDTTTSLFDTKSRVSELELQIDEIRQEHKVQQTAAQGQIADLKQEGRVFSTELATIRAQLVATQNELVATQSDLAVLQRQEVSARNLVAEREAELSKKTTELLATKSDLKEKILGLEELSSQLKASVDKQAQLQEESELAKLSNDENARYLELTKGELASKIEELETLRQRYSGKLNDATTTLSYTEERALNAESQLRENERKIAEQEVSFRREIEALKRDVLLQKRAIEEKAKQDQEVVAKLLDRKYVVVINELEAEHQKIQEAKELLIKNQEGVLSKLQEERDGLVASVHEWNNKAVEWEITKKEMAKLATAKDTLETKLLQADNSIQILTKAKEDEEKKNRQNAVVCERAKLELAAEKQRTKALSEQLRSVVTRLESVASIRDLSHSTAALLEELSMTPPPPPPTPPTDTTGPPASTVDSVPRRAGAISADDFASKKGDLKPVKNTPRAAGFGSRANAATAPTTLADVLFASMQKRFQQINRDDVEELRADDDSSASSSEEELDEWHVF